MLIKKDFMKPLASLLTLCSLSHGVHAEVKTVVLKPVEIKKMELLSSKDFKTPLSLREEEFLSLKKPFLKNISTQGEKEGLIWAAGLKNFSVEGDFCSPRRYSNNGQGNSGAFNIAGSMGFTEQNLVAGSKIKGVINFKNSGKNLEFSDYKVSLEMDRHFTCHINSSSSAHKGGLRAIHDLVVGSGLTTHAHTNFNVSADLGLHFWSGKDQKSKNLILDVDLPSFEELGEGIMDRGFKFDKAPKKVKSPLEKFKEGVTFSPLSAKMPLAGNFHWKPARWIEAVHASGGIGLFSTKIECAPLDGETGTSSVLKERRLLMGRISAKTPLIFDRMKLALGGSFNNGNRLDMGMKDKLILSGTTRFTGSALFGCSLEKLPYVQKFFLGLGANFFKGFDQAPLVIAAEKEANQSASTGQDVAKKLDQNLLFESLALSLGLSYEFLSLVGLDFGLNLHLLPFLADKFEFFQKKFFDQCAETYLNQAGLSGENKNYFQKYIGVSFSISLI